MISPYINNVSVVVATLHNAEEVTQRISPMLPSDGVQLIVVNDEGKGVSYARNRGLDQADGEWVLMMDDDDTIDPNIFNILNQRIKGLPGSVAAHNISILEWGYRITDGSKVQEVKLVENPEFIEGSQLVQLMVENTRFTSNLWNKLIHRDLIGKIRFNESLSYGEDWDFLWRLISQPEEKGLMIIPDLLYDYVQHPEQVSAGFRAAKLTLPDAWATMLSDISAHHPSLLSEARATYASHLTVVLYSAHRSNAASTITKPLRQALRHHLPQLWKSPHHSLKKKLAATWLSV